MGSFRLTLLSMFISVLCYGLSMGLLTSTVFVSLLFVHEMGHVWFARWRNIPVSIPLFIPFVGALIAIDERDLDTPQNEAWIGLGGPLVGGIGAALGYLVWAVWCPQSVEIALGINLALFLNVFNMLPLRPFDGGRIAQIVGRWTEVLGLFILVTHTWFHFSPLLVFIWLMVFCEGVRKKSQHEVKLRERILWGLGYFVLYLGLRITLASQFHLFAKLHPNIIK